METYFQEESEDELRLRAISYDPKFVLLDEPFAGVDPVAVEDIQRIVAHLKKEKYRDFNH